MLWGHNNYSKSFSYLDDFSIFIFNMKTRWIIEQISFMESEFWLTPILPYLVHSQKIPSKRKEIPFIKRKSFIKRFPRRPAVKLTLLLVERRGGGNIGTLLFLLSISYQNIFFSFVTMGAIIYSLKKKTDQIFPRKQRYQ